MTNIAKKQDRWPTPEEEAAYEKTARMVAAAGGISRNHALLLDTIAMQCKPRVVMSLAELSDRMSLSQKVTLRAVSDLEALQLLRVWRAVDGRQRRPRPVAYEIRLDRLAEIRRRDV